LGISIIHYTKEFGRKIPVSEKISGPAGPTLGKEHPSFFITIRRSRRRGPDYRLVGEGNSGCMRIGKTSGRAFGKSPQIGRASKKPMRNVFPGR
jgi:hypothetical protein